MESLVFRVYETQNLDAFVVNCSGSTGACLVNNFENVCTIQQQCSDVYQSTIQCKDCESLSQSCQNKCLFFQSTESCADFSQCTYDTAIFYQKPCQGGKASFGQTCKCCTHIEFNGEPAADTNFCTSIYPFDSQTLRSFSQESSPDDNNQDQTDDDQYQVNLRMGKTFWIAPHFSFGYFTSFFVCFIIIVSVFSISTILIADCPSIYRRFLLF